MATNLKINIVVAMPQGGSVLRILSQWAEEGNHDVAARKHAGKLFEESRLNKKNMVATLALRESRSARKRDVEAGVLRARRREAAGERDSGGRINHLTGVGQPSAGRGDSEAGAVPRGSRTTSAAAH